MVTLRPGLRLPTAANVGHHWVGEEVSSGVPCPPEKGLSSILVPLPWDPENEEVSGHSFDLRKWWWFWFPEEVSCSWDSTPTKRRVTGSQRGPPTCAVDACGTFSVYQATALTAAYRLIKYASSFRV